MLVRRDEGVSPVIGVILMVAVTVILAAVIAAFVFGMAGGITKTKAVAATARQSQSNITVIWQGGNDNSLVQSYNISIRNSSGTTKLAVVPNNIVGNTTTVKEIASSGQDHVTVTAAFTDGTQQVVLDTMV